MDRYLESVILAEDYQRKTAALRDELDLLEAEIRALEVTQDQPLEETNLKTKERHSTLSSAEVFRTISMTKAIALVLWLGEEDSNPR